MRAATINDALYGTHNTNTMRHNFGTETTPRVGLFDALEHTRANVAENPEAHQMNIMKMMNLIEAFGI